MKAEKTTNEKDLAEFHITVASTDAELLQTVVLQFAEKVSQVKAHAARMRRLAILIDKKL